MTIANFGPEDSGTFTCSGLSVAGNASAGFRIRADKGDAKKVAKKGKFSVIVGEFCVVVVVFYVIMVMFYVIVVVFYVIVGEFYIIVGVFCVIMGVLCVNLVAKSGILSRKNISG